MFTLTFVEPSGRREVVPLVDEERGVVVGREATCDFVVESKEVSRRHARFFVRNGALVVEDLGSHNGVYFNDARAEGPTEVPVGVELELGDVKCTAAGSAARAAAPARAGAAGRAARSTPAVEAPKDPPQQGSARAGAAAARARAIAQQEAKGGGAGKAAAERKAPPKAAPAPTLKTGEEGIEGVGAGAALRGMGKGAAEIKLPPKATVGRVAECDVVLDDDSVSRRHAELYRDERGFYRIRDLDSANGTFLDGRPVAKDELLPDGARLRFGDVELLFWKPAAAPPDPNARQKLMLGALVAMVALFAGLYFLQEKRRAQREAQAAAEEQTPEDEARALAEQAQGAIESDRFDEAVRLAQAASERDPLAQAPRRLIVQARREQAAAKVFAEAQSKAGLGNEDEALRLFAQVDPQSRFFARARIKAKDLATGLVRSHGRTCLAKTSREVWEDAAAECGMALDIKCQLQTSLEADLFYKSLRKAEKALGRKVPWACPPQLAPLFHDTLPGDEQSAADAQKALKTRYPDEKVLAAVKAYTKGDLATALRNLTNPAVAKGRSAALATEAAEKVRLVDGRFREGQTALLRGELTKVDELWSQALAADSALLPPGIASYYADQMRGTLTQAHTKSGDEKYSKGQYSSAYDEYTRGLSANPKDGHLLDQLARLEKVAEELVASGGCEQLQSAARMTRAEPPSPAHAAAVRGLEKCR